MRKIHSVRMYGRARLAFTLAISIAAVACGEDEPRARGADAAAEGGPPDVRPPGVDGTAGDSSDGPGAAVQAKYHQFLSDLEAHYKARRASCFGGPIERLNNPPVAVLPDDGVSPSLRLGLQRFDEAAARTCLATAATTSCARIADMLARTGPADPVAGVEVCWGVLSGSVAPGSLCLRPQDCQSPDQFTCDGSNACQVCTPRARHKLGEDCLAGEPNCPVGAACRPDPAPSLASSCQPLGLDGERCHEDHECAAGLFCTPLRPDAILDGICRPETLGKPCAGSWECLFVHACIGAAPGKAGTCQIGKGVGEPCSIHGRGVNDIAYSDCGDLLDCLDLDGKGPRCVAGAKIGAACGPVGPSPKDGWVVCIEGHCTATSTSPGSCERHRILGEPCEDETNCDSGLACPAAGPGAKTCTPPRHLATGEKCSFGGAPYCAKDLYCAFPPDFDELNPNVPPDGTCAPQRKIGETCRASIDLCEPLAKCIVGICKPC